MKFPLTFVQSIVSVASVAALSALSAAPASAFTFGNIVGGDTVGDAYKDSFTFDVTGDASSVFFKIANSGNAAASTMFISKVFFDDNGYLSAPSANVGNTGDVAFTGGASGDRLPQGGNGFTTDYAFSSNNGAGNKWGVQGGEALGLSFSGNYNNVVAALNSGALKLGLHVQALPNGASDSFISSSGNTENTPEPLTMLAAGAAVGFGAMFKKQRAQAQKAE
ncbi:MAG: PEP-CTERM sorting domain-containing protein [Microcoleus sp. PH2017_10_PVI_O_A]|uniref:PEP-CTERM sorting domain-containing protein n=1 Tax=unclassified Microcoleus TaxID=2642155 RepID=UPI001D832002|nr:MULTISPECIES: PEP-CTERM sorting domain-containing protein [unclassified Microcoleus]TAE83442.1 MAG: PEP-CTERM sorting domain-containing protein [Oscillatoriales cyanobacterium]MCC3404533.1 PEP-CTERM sorting domain-containing protein [Microcoleus sp. PH2017_10_PVI_O_A]MCC3458601.1 PEP-CTERM sorting domain-containing protein [Microcoleus sp. PH2017_11_PCY_U_A]MCC3476851.1 PEP-CTERM sorting domain-containing protein [Microcoleus sp. PH2017_12_PCY_D_A]MCC3526989.1 PEP-CTERM sorting domain-conta